MGADDFWFPIQQQKVCVEQNDGSSDRVSESNMLQLNQNEHRSVVGAFFSASFH